MTAMTFFYWGLGATGVLLSLWAGYTTIFEGGLGQPEYTVTERMDHGEIRQYPPFLVALTQPSIDGDDGLREGFRTLAGYIFGGNKPQEKLAMTAPVIQQNNTGESLPMTAPVLTGSQEMMMAFVMPAGRTKEDLPVPNSSNVQLEEVDWGAVAAITFAGRGKQHRFVEHEKRLRALIEQHGRKARAPALYAQYNSPTAFPPLRRNEVLIPLQPKAD